MIFLGCNYGNKKVKTHFDNLKRAWESAWPVEVVLIDKEKGKGAADLWRQIKAAIEKCSLAIFDVSAFRPNVVLELGYALAKKSESSIIVAFDSRKPPGKKKPDWPLTDISQLTQVRYTTLEGLDKKLEEHVNLLPQMQDLVSFQEAAKSSTAVWKKYNEVGIELLQKMRDRGSISEKQFCQTVKDLGLNVRINTLKALLKKHHLATRSAGANGRWKLAN
jgi:hypothetical protein